MDYQALAQNIVTCVGGEDNVVHLEHCSTRLRFQLADHDKVDVEALKKVSGVMGVIDAAQFQVVIGNDVIEAYDAIMKAYSFGAAPAQASSPVKRSVGSVLLEYLVGIFQPLVPAIAGAGVLKSILLLLSMFGLLSSTDVVHTMLAAISDATFYFLPIMVAVTTANMFKSNRLVAVAAVGYLLLPATTTALADGMRIFGLTAANIAYNSQVFPAILEVILLSLLERGLNRVSPKAIRVFFVPMVSLAVTIPATLLFLGPLGYNAGQLLTTAILFMYNTFGWVALGVLAAILPFMISMGMHKALVPYAVSSLSATGFESLYLPASLGHNISEAGACLAVAVRTKDSALRQTAISAGVSALFGITEPALYGVTLQHKRVMTGVVVSGAISGVVIGLLGVKAFVAVGPGIASMTMYVDQANAQNLVNAFIGLAVALCASFAFTFLTWKDGGADADAADAAIPSDAADAKPAVAAPAAADCVPVEVVSPLAGEAADITTVSDELFANKTLGDGIAVRPSKGVLCAPVDATVSMVFDTRHAIGLTTPEGVELLMHIGLDTVKMEGDGFVAKVKVGDHVVPGDELIDFDLDKITAAGLDSTVCVIVSNASEFDVSAQASGPVEVGAPLFTVSRKDA